MKILTFDTALNKTYISLSEDDNVIEKLAIESDKDKYHSAYLIKEIAEILKKNSLKMQDIDAVGINIGPGSFTGIRACTTVGRIIAQQINVPLIPVSSTEILSRIEKTAQKVFVTLDARKNSAFFAVYENCDEKSAPQIITVDELIRKIKENNCVVVADSSMAEKLNEMEICVTNYEDGNYPLNVYLAKITYEKLVSAQANKETFNWAKVKPLYIQPPSVFSGKK